MIILKRRRLIVWLIKAYLRRWRKTILLCFILGISFFYIFKLAIPVLLPKVPFVQKKTIGLVGAYTPDTLPSSILSKVSRGLTYISDDGNIHPDVAQSWDIENSGRTYVFHLYHGVKFSDGTPLVSNLVNYNFSDVVTKRPDNYTISYTLKEPYAPFLVTVSRPIFKGNFVGAGAYKIKNVKLNATFVESLELAQVNNPLSTIFYQFYPTDDALKTAFALGEVSQADNLSSVDFEHTTFSHFKNASVAKTIDYNNLVTLFYNTTDKDLSDKKIREGLNYALPQNFSQGLRNDTPYPPSFWAASPEILPFQQDIVHAKALMPTPDKKTGKTVSLTLETLPEYMQVAEEIAKSWKNLGVDTTIEQVSTVPTTFQIFLGKFTVSKDPDQYVLWHSDQKDNITNYNSKRVDLLLEQGRKTIDKTTRQKIYADFEKYFLDDAPASFLFFPYQYTVTRK